MKHLFKILTVIMILFVCSSSSFALNVSKLDKLVTKSNLNQTSVVAVSVKNAENGSDVYSYNELKLLHPASVLKIFTAYSALEELGYDYNFKTQFYKDKQNNLYIKLGADPMLTTAKLKQAFQKLKADGVTQVNNLYIDDSIIDKKEFSQGWMWDDDVNPSTPKVSAYNLDGNVLNIDLAKNSNGSVEVNMKPNYSTAVKTDVEFNQKLNYINVERYNWLSPEIIEINGYTTSAKNFKVPISSMRRYFVYNTQKILADTKFVVKGTRFASKNVPSDAVMVGEITNPVTSTLPYILQNSNNLMAETVFKLAAGKKYNTTGTDDIAAVMFNDYYKNLGMKNDGIIIKDGCGVSRNNLFTADWITSALSKLYKDADFSKFKENMAQPGDGTLGNRMFDLRGNAWLKTGSLSNVSTIAGYVHSQDGYTYSVSVLIQNFNIQQQDVKSFEDEIINLIYNR